MKQSKLFSTISQLILGVSAIFAEKIENINEKDSKNYELIVALFYNTIFSILFTTISTFIIALLLYPFSQSFTYIWYTLFKLMFVFSIFMILLNLLSKKLNIPMILIQILLSIKNKYKTIEWFVFSIFASYMLVAAIIIILHNIFLEIFNRNNINNDSATFYSIIIAVSLTIASFYAFPTNKNDRDRNELIISPLLILANIWIGYSVSQHNIIINAEKGDEKMVSNLILLFFITACLQIITYFKKLFEKLHDLPSYDKNVRVYSKIARKQIRRINTNLKEHIVEIRSFYEEIKIIKKDKNYYIKLFYIIILVPILVYGLNYFINFFSYQLSSYQLNDSFIRVISYLLLIIFSLFLLSRLYIFFFLLFKGKNLISRSEKWETVSLILFILGILIFMSVGVFFKQLFSENILFFVIICIFLSGIIFITNTFINWLFSKTKSKKT